MVELQDVLEHSWVLAVDSPVRVCLEVVSLLDVVPLSAQELQSYHLLELRRVLLVGVLISCSFLTLGLRGFHPLSTPFWQDSGVRGSVVLFLPLSSIDTALLGRFVVCTTVVS